MRSQGLWDRQTWPYTHELYGRSKRTGRSELLISTVHKCWASLHAEVEASRRRMRAGGATRIVADGPGVYIREEAE